jgi:hypothetical protein
MIECLARNSKHVSIEPSGPVDILLGRGAASAAPEEYEPYQSSSRGARASGAIERDEGICFFPERLSLSNEKADSSMAEAIS